MTAKNVVRCASCKTPLDERTVSKLTRQALSEQRQQFLAQKRLFERDTRNLKTGQQKAILKIAESNRQEKKRIQRDVNERLHRGRIAFEQEFSRLRSVYEQNLAQIKGVCGRQNGIMLDELRRSISNSAEAERKQLSRVVDDINLRFQEIQGWLQNDLPGKMLESVNAANDTDSQSEPDIDRMMQEISSRDEQIEQAKERIRLLEEKLESKRGRPIWKRINRTPPEPYKEEEQTDPQEEILKIIREIAQEREKADRVRNDASARHSQPHFADSFGSRMSQKIMH